MVKRAGLLGLRFHDLRHHCITRLAEAGVADQTLMAIAGHVSKSMLDHYSHVRLQARRSAVDALVDTIRQDAALATSNEAREAQAIAETVN